MLNFSKVSCYSKEVMLLNSYTILSGNSKSLSTFKKIFCDLYDRLQVVHIIVSITKELNTLPDVPWIKSSS